MKKTIVLILLLIPTLCFAGALQEKHRSVIVKKNVAAGGSENIGFESVGESEAYFADDYINCVRLSETPAHNGTVQSIVFTTKVGASDVTGSIYFSIYTNGSGKPDELVANSNVGPINTSYNGGTAYDLTYNYTGTKPTVASGATYWICINNDGTVTNSIRFRTDGAGSCATTGNCVVAEANAHDNFPANWDSITPDYTNDGRNFGKLYFTYSW